MPGTLSQHSMHIISQPGLPDLHQSTVNIIMSKPSLPQQHTHTHGSKGLSRASDLKLWLLVVTRNITI